MTLGAIEEDDERNRENEKMREFERMRESEGVRKRKWGGRFLKREKREKL